MASLHLDSIGEVQHRLRPGSHQASWNIEHAPRRRHHTHTTLDDMSKGQAGHPESLSAVNRNTIVACSARGTRIETATGPVHAKDLAAGDGVVTVGDLAEPGAIGDDPNAAVAVSQPVMWTGSRAVDRARHPRPETVWPIRVKMSDSAVLRPVSLLIVKLVRTMPGHYPQCQ
jgi:hypothetical protein